MKAIVQHRYGPPAVLALEEIGKPAVGDQDLLIRVHAATINLADDVMVRGVPYIARLGGGLHRPRHGIRGMDVAGTVTEAGAKVTDLRPGDEVFGSCGDLYHGGAFAEYARVPRDKLVPKPPALTFEQAAAVPVTGCAALQALRDAAQVQPGQQVLINGASGGVGTFAVQIAKALGAQVTGVCSTRNIDLVRSLGADAVIDYTKEDFTRGTQRFDVILDNVANHPLSHCLRALTRKGTLIPNANTPGRWLGGLGRIYQARLMAPFVPHRIRVSHTRVNQHDLLAVTKLIDSGKITPVIDRTYSLSETPEAFRYWEQRHARGKVVITA
jgi:NADPH:quinone reductase-like Zn-dependent oxidoreductase